MRSRLVRKYWTASDSCPSDMPEAERPEGSLLGPLLLIMYSFRVSKLSICSGKAWYSQTDRHQIEERVRGRKVGRVIIPALAQVPGVRGGGGA